MFPSLKTPISTLKRGFLQVRFPWLETPQTAHFFFCLTMGNCGNEHITGHQNHSHHLGGWDSGCAHREDTAPGQQKTKEGPWVGSLWLFSFSRTQPGYPCFLILPGALTGPFLCLQLSSDIMAGNLQRVFKGKWLRRKRTLKFHTMSLCYMWQGWDFNAGQLAGSRPHILHPIKEQWSKET